MKNIMLLILLASMLAGCEDFPIEGGDDLAAAKPASVQPRHAHGGLDDRLLNADSGR